MGDGSKTGLRTAKNGKKLSLLHIEKPEKYKTNKNQDKEYKIFIEISRILIENLGEYQ